MSGASAPLVVGVDGSERSRDALALAVDLAEPDQQMVCVHCHPYGRLSNLLAGGEYERLVRDVAESTLRAVQDILPPPMARNMRLVSNPSPAAGLQHFAEEIGAPMIIVGSSHRSRLGCVLAGSIAESLLTGAPRPVAIAPHGYATASHALATIGCGFNGSSESYEALVWADTVASRTGARLQLLGVHRPVAFGGTSASGVFGYESANAVLRRELEQQMHEALASHAQSGEAGARLLEGDVATELIAASAELDLLALGSRGYGPVRSVMLGSVSRALIRSARCAIVVLPRSLATPQPDPPR